MGGEKKNSWPRRGGAKKSARKRALNKPMSSSGSGKPAGESSTRDERARLEGELRQAQKMESIGHLAGGLAHDFNNILNIIAAYTGLLERGIDHQKRAEALDGIQRAVQRGAAVVRQLLTFARREGVSFRLVDVNEIVRECAEMISETFPKRITISLNLSPDLPKIHANANQLHQAILNLCVNARDAISGRGQLTLGTEIVPGTNIRPLFAEASEDLYVCVGTSDTGAGMDEETRSRIFEPFFTTKGVSGGSGLGLPVVYGIVKSHAGFIGLKSEPGNGTSFSLYFPVHRAEEDPKKRDSDARHEAAREEGVVLSG